MHLRGRSGLSRPHGRAGTEDSPRTPHERESGGSSHNGPKTRAGAARGHLSSTLQPAQTARLYVLSRPKPSELPAFAASSRPQRSVANPIGPGKMRATGDGFDPLRPSSPKRGNVTGRCGAPNLQIALNFPAKGVRGLSVYFSAASRPIELSLQSSFQLSLMVLVIYRSRA